MYTLNEYYRELFGEKVYKIALDAGFSCPNRDGTLGTRGCIFCSSGGSGDFAESRQKSITEQIEDGIRHLQEKSKNTGNKYIAYFQAYTNTYASVEVLRKLYTEALSHPSVVGVSIATRPDCMDQDVICLINELQQLKPVWIELGLQTIHEKSAEFIRRGYSLPCFTQCVHHLQEYDIPVIAHVILGLPGETKEQMLQTVEYVGRLGIKGIKLQLLHVLTDTDLYEYYVNHEFETLTLEEYADIVASCIEILPSDVVIHRLTGDGPKDTLAAPLWSRDKRKVLNTIHKEIRNRIM